MDIRDRATEVAASYDFSVDASNSFDDGKSLFSYISDEEIFACTTCNACVEACPVLINPLEPILELRRYKLLTESQGPSEWMPMFNQLKTMGLYGKCQTRGLTGPMPLTNNKIDKVKVYTVEEYKSKGTDPEIVFWWVVPGVSMPELRRLLWHWSKYYIKLTSSSPCWAMMNRVQGIRQEEQETNFYFKCLPFRILKLSKCTM